MYLYRTPGSRRIKYVGYGETPARALGHSGGSHNGALQEWLVGGEYSLEIAGPYGTAAEGKTVEAALISAIEPEFNRSPGEGRRFVPVGVPPELADRVAEAPISESELAVRAGGALFVYLSAGDVMADGRIKANPAHPDVEVIAGDTEGWWQVDRHMESWTAAPPERPQTLIAVHGPGPRSRFVIGAFAINTDRLGHDWGTEKDGALWRLPLLDRTNADACGLRGLKISEAKFGRGRQLHYHWYDADGVLRWDGR